MAYYENTAFLTTYIAYTFAIVMYVWYFISKNNKIGRYATSITIIGWLANTCALVMRTINAGRLPLANGYEFLLSFAWGIILIYLIMEFRYKLKSAGAFIIPIAWFLLTYVVIKIPEAQKGVAPLMPALKSNWLTFHVTTAIISYGAFAVAFGLTIMFLLKEKETKSAIDSEVIDSKLPDASLLDELSYRAITIGFFLLTIVIITGAVWAEQAWGSYWSWDPKETWSLITWFIYGAYLHARLMLGWKGRPAAILSIIGFLAVIFTFFGVNYLLSGLHSYA